MSPQLVLVSMSGNILPLAIRKLFALHMGFCWSGIVATMSPINAFKICLNIHCTYLLVWNVTEGDEGIAGLKSWLNNISTRAPGSHIIVVGTFVDEILYV